MPTETPFESGRATGQAERIGRPKRARVCASAAMAVVLLSFGVHASDLHASETTVEPLLDADSRHVATARTAKRPVERAQALILGLGDSAAINDDSEDHGITLRRLRALALATMQISRASDGARQPTSQLKFWKLRADVSNF